MPNSVTDIVLRSPDDQQVKNLLRAYFDDIASRYYCRPATESEIDQVLLEQSSEQHSAARGLVRLRLDVRSDLVEAQRLYVRAGYEPVEAFNDSPWAGHWFQKELAWPGRSYW